MASGFSEHRQDSRAAAAAALHAGAAGGLSHRRVRHHARGQPGGDERRSSTRRSGSFLGMFNMFSGGALEQMSIFALGIMPYISASIIMQLLTVVVPKLEQLQQGGRAGAAEDQPVHPLRLHRPVARAVVLHRALADRQQPRQYAPVRRGGARSRAGTSTCITMISLTTGTAFIMWLGEQITERGIGNGISLIIFAGIVCDMPDAPSTSWSSRPRRGEITAFALAVIGAGRRAGGRRGIIFFERGQRRIPVQYAKRVVGPKDVRRAVHPPAAEGQHRRRHPADLRLVDPDVPAADRRRSSQNALDAAASPTRCTRATGATTSSTSR